MNKVALGWADAGIKTVDQAKDDAAAHSQIYYSVMKALGITGREQPCSCTEGLNVLW